MGQGDRRPLSRCHLASTPSPADRSCCCGCSSGACRCRGLLAVAAEAEAAVALGVRGWALGVHGREGCARRRCNQSVRAEAMRSRRLRNIVDCGPPPPPSPDDDWWPGDISSSAAASNTCRDVAGWRVHAHDQETQNADVMLQCYTVGLLLRKRTHTLPISVARHSLAFQHHPAQILPTTSPPHPSAPAGPPPPMAPRPPTHLRLHVSAVPRQRLVVGEGPLQQRQGSAVAGQRVVVLPAGDGLHAAAEVPAAQHDTCGAHSVARACTVPRVRMRLPHEVRQLCWGLRRRGATE